jgi:DNA-binding NarL/FixJ family response regulator
MPIRLIVADDHPPILNGLELFLSQEPDFEVVASYQDGVETLQAVQQLHPNILILDSHMRGKDGLAILRELHQTAIPTRVVLLTAGMMDEDSFLEAMRLGVGGVVLKEMTVPHLIQCIRKVYAGEQWLAGFAIYRTVEEMPRRQVHAGDQVLIAETKPIQIFLCHASEDKAAVTAIYDRLKALGYKPWLDKKDLLPGQLWEEEIPKAIRASDFILIFLSKNSIPKRGYVQTEFKLTLDAWMRVPQGMIHTIPVRLDDSEIPEQFRQFHWCNLFEADGFATLLRAFPPPPVRPIRYGGGASSL